MVTSPTFPVYDVPLPGGDYDITIASNNRDFISSPAFGCTQTYSIEMANGLLAPDYYSIDPTTAEISFTNKASNLVND